MDMMPKKKTRQSMCVVGGGGGEGDLDESRDRR